MADEQTAETLAEVKTPIETPVNDGIIDLDALDEVKPQTTDEEDAAATKDAEPKAGDEEPAKKPSGAQRAKVREQRLLAELQTREREIEELRRSQPAAKTAGESDEKPPREEDFNGDFFAYRDAKSAFEARQAIRDELRKDRETRETSERTTKQADIARERSVAHLERVEDARETITDFDQVMEGMKNVNVRQGIIDEIMSSDKSALLAYHLAQNPEKLQAMDRMSGRELAREMGRLEATVQLPTAKKATTAPAPLGRTKGGASPSSAESDLAAWMKKTYG